MKDKKCPECGFEIIGRINKKFCSDRCRSVYNNRQNKILNEPVNRINGILKNNRKILSGLYLTGKTKLPAKKLAGHGFNFDYFTHICPDTKGKKQFFCYEYGYSRRQNEKIKLVKEESINK
jgi:hypothetical protein